MNTENTDIENKHIEESLSSQGEPQSQTEQEASTPSDDRFADPATDEDPRTSDEGMTSVGAVDLNADTATADTDSPEAVPGVRSG